MPDLGYIQPPPLTPTEILKSLENLNTILSIRLNLDEHHKIPYHFKDYTIQNGRVTFKVKGEFEVDLTVADEDPESQFWFIDFKFLFSPSVSDLAPHLRSHIEQQVNKALAEEGLTGCYKYLHGLVLSHQISEFRRQAVALSRGTWVETLAVEPLNRALSIQYWLNRYGQKGPKSWIILGVHSGKRKTGVPHPKDTPRLFLRWFREGKEMKDVDIPFQTATVSAESLLKTVIAQHIRLILEATYDQLLKKPIYAKGGARVAVYLDNEQPSESKLTVQLTSERQVFIKIEPITGRCIVGPASRLTGLHEFKFNQDIPDADKFLHARIDELRYDAIAEYISSRSVTAGWHRLPNPGLGREDLKALVPEGTAQVLWFKRSGWTKNWHLAVSMGSTGESWWLIETTEPTPQVISHGPRKIEKKMVHMLHESRNVRSPMQLPAIFARISNLVDWKNKTTRDLVKLSFQGLESCRSAKLDGTPRHGAEASGQPNSPENNVVMITEARINIPVPDTLKTMKENIDQDIAFDSNTGMLALRLRSKIGDSVIPTLVERTIRVFRLVEFVKVLQEHSASLKCEQISLGKITFTYGTSRAAQDLDKMDEDTPSKQYTAMIDFSGSANSMSLILEKGNPHLMIADLLRSILNGKEGLGGVATLLPVTLPLLAGLDTIEMAWATVSKTKGEVFVLVRATDWYEIRYNILSASSDSNISTNLRKVTFEIKLRHRAGVPWWDIRRSDQQDPLGDDIEAVLKPVWNLSGTGFQGMRPHRNLDHKVNN
ncbi:putative Mediator of RNA polymerase II transcription subunit 14 [Glarea lozoyensis 74030]|uniref:Mediator of RNA polymerase II transcription subunit 14 n=1 Tax=Glarea lozoyensis (strain ATCC 74030 / MF5533) TaxID=1104152 RepID=H0ECU7_GLAL7|nr:putative Mediator of RNA polymerase II transcription subunit 14 [Glarea lozoyensis 74030]